MSSGFQASEEREEQMCPRGQPLPIARRAALLLVAAFYLECAFSDPPSQVVEFGAADLAALGHLDLGNTG